MGRIYLDNGSTSFPKAPGVAEAMAHFITSVGVNIHRGSYEDAYSAARFVADARKRLADLFGAEKSNNIVFTSSVTASLNMLLKGFLRPGDHVLTSSLEHNAVMRTLVQLAGNGVSFDRIPCTPDGEMRIEAIKGMLRSSTRAVVMTHSSNVCGTLMPIEEVGEICSRRGIAFILDSAQTAGIFPLNMKDMNIDAIAFTGHKGLLGPQGIGGFAVSDRIAEQTDPLIAGGTGSRSDQEEMPEFLPDKFEAGTMNLPGIYGLHAALKWLEKTGIDTIRRHEMALCERFIDRLAGIRGVKLVGTDIISRRGPVVSIDCPKRDNAEIAFRLEEEYGIMTRCGLHCAPSAHKVLGTFPRGTIRFVPGYATEEKEIDAAVDALKEIIKETGQ